MSMFFLIDSASELIEYTSGLPDLEKEEIWGKTIEIWESRTGNEREEFGTFQAFDRSGNVLFGQDRARELELTINDRLEKEGYPIKLEVRQIQISIPFYPFRIPTQTYEIVVLDNPDHEALDPIWTRMIEEQWDTEKR